jgi:hypothetical protein
VYLVVFQHVPIERCAQLIADITGAQVSADCFLLLGPILPTWGHGGSASAGQDGRDRDDHRSGQEAERWGQGYGGPRYGPSSCGTGRYTAGAPDRRPIHPLHERV